MHFSQKKFSLQEPFLLIRVLLALLFCGIYSYYAFHLFSTISTKSTSHVITTNTPSQSSNQATPPPNAFSAKNALLMRTLHGLDQSGIVYQSPNVQVEYIAGDKLFQAEILSIQLTKAKQETETWFRSQGITQNEICNLPLMFYINPAIKENLSTIDQQVNLLPDGC